MKLIYPSILIILMIATVNLEKNVPIILCDTNLKVFQRVIRKKKIVKLGMFDTFVMIYKNTLRLHCTRGFVGGCLVWVCSWSEWALLAGCALFLLSSMGTWCQIAATFVAKPSLSKLARYYNMWFSLTYRVLVYTLLIATVRVNVAHFAALKEAPRAYLEPCVMLLCASSIQIEGNADFREAFHYPGILKIEESERLYRITIGVMEWEFAKSNTFMRIVFAVLIYSALSVRGRTQIINAETLAQALGWKNKLVFYFMFIKYQRAGNDLCAIIKQAISAHVRDIRNQALSVWMEDLTQTVEQIRDRLHTKGMSVSVDKIREALQFVDFNNLVQTLRNRYRPKRELDTISELEVHEHGDNYRFQFGPLVWDIAKSDRFQQVALLSSLYQARDREGKKIFALNRMYQVIVNSRQRLDQLFDQYNMLAERFRTLIWVGNKRSENDILTAAIQKIWLEDFTLTPQQVAQRLVELNLVDTITTERVCKLSGNVELLKIRRQVSKDYQQGKYRKSTEWIMSKYQQIIRDLLTCLKQGQTWSRAQIEKYVDHLPQTLPSEHLQTPEPVCSNLAWLKCFLFNLPKTLDNKIICPHCGSSETSRKSAVPESLYVKDSKTDQNLCVQTFRFYCNNPDCSHQTFSATPDGSHILDEHQFAKACLMLRLTMQLRGSYRQVGRLLGVSASTVFAQLSHIAETTRRWEEILGVTRFSGTLCIDEKFVKVAELKWTSKRRFGYLFFAIDPQSGDLLHIEIFASRGQDAVEAFLTAIKVRGIVPEVIMTDLMSAYDQAIRNVFGRQVTIAKCHFHFKQNIFEHMRKQFGKKDIPELAKQLKNDIFMVVDYTSKKSIVHWYNELLKLKPRYLEREPRLSHLFNCLDSYLPHLLSVIENPRVTIMTNNSAEQAIRNFNQRYKLTAGFETLQTAQRHAQLFQLVYRFSPYSQDAQDHKRGKTPLELAGYDICHMPIYQYLTEPLLFNLEPARNLASCQNRSA